MSIQADAQISTLGFEEGAASANFRFGRLLKRDDQHLYGGAQLLGIMPINVQEPEFTLYPETAVLALGGFIGLAWDTAGDWDVQVELAAAPIFLSGNGEDNSALVLTNDLIISSYAQIGFAMQYRKERDARAPTSAP